MWIGQLKHDRQMIVIRIALTESLHGVEIHDDIALGQFVQ